MSWGLHLTGREWTVGPWGSVGWYSHWRGGSHKAVTLYTSTTYNSSHRPASIRYTAIFLLTSCRSDTPATLRYSVITNSPSSDLMVVVGNLWIWTTECGQNNGRFCFKPSRVKLVITSNHRIMKWSGIRRYMNYDHSQQWLAAITARCIILIIVHCSTLLQPIPEHQGAREGWISWWRKTKTRCGVSPLKIEFKKTLWARYAM